MIKIPWQSLSADALIGVIDAYVLKEGTDYGAGPDLPSLEQKRQAVRRQLEEGSALIVFDPAQESTDLILSADFREE